MSTATPKGSPAWVSDDLVACIDGPLQNQWFTAEDWAQRVDAARYMHEERGQRRQPCLDYAADGRVSHPHWPQASGTAMRHQAGRTS